MCTWHDKNIQSEPDYVPRIFSYRKKNLNQSQKLERFRRMENHRRHPKSTGKTGKDEHENTGRNADITFEVIKYWTPQKWKRLDNLGNQELSVFASIGIGFFLVLTKTLNHRSRSFSVILKTKFCMVSFSCLPVTYKNCLNFILLNCLHLIFLRARSLVVSDLRLETKSFQFDSGCWLCAEVSSLQ